MNLFFDTETSGLWKDDLDPLDPGQPHLVQLGAQLFDDDWRRIGILTTLIKPEGWAIEDGAEEVHGITTGLCARGGIPLGSAIVALMGLVAPARRLVGHHVQFDRRVISASINRLKASGVWWYRAGSKMLCTMEASTKPCGIEGEYGAKFPSLEEAVAILCPGVEFPVKHDAESDIAACVAVYRKLVERGDVIEAKGYAMEVD